MIQDFLAPELRRHRAELVSIRVDLNAKIDMLKSEMCSAFSALGAQLETAVLRGELSPTREIAGLLIRVGGWKKNEVSCLNS